MVFVQVWAANCMNLWAAKKIKYAQRAWVTGVPNLLVFCSVPFHSMCILQTLPSPALISKAV